MDFPSSSFDKVLVGVGYLFELARSGLSFFLSFDSIADELKTGPRVYLCLD